MSIEEILAALQAILDGAQGRDLSDEEVERYEQLEADLAVKQRDAQVRARQGAYMTPTGAPAPATATAGQDSELERAFDHYLRTGVANHDIAELRAQGVATGAAGGFTVPEGFRAKITERLLAFGGISDIAETITTESGNDLPWPTVDDTANQGAIVAEGGTFASGADVVFGQKTLKAFKYMAGGAGNVALKVSYELLQDSAFDIAAFLARALGTRIARIQAVHFARGAGTTEPQGLMTGLTSSLTLTTAATPTYDQLVSLVHDVDPDYRMGARWVFSDAVLENIRKIKDTQNRPLWEPQAQAGMGTLPGGTLLGFPVTIDQGILSTGLSTKVIAFGNISEAYVIRRVRDIQVVVLNEKYSENGQVGYFAWARADGLVQNPNAATVAINPTI